MKKHMPGFVPVQYKKVGRFLLALGIAVSLVSLISKFTSLLTLPNYVLYFGLVLILLSLYLLFIVPKEE